MHGLLSIVTYSKASTADSCTFRQFACQAETVGNAVRQKIGCWDFVLAAARSYAAGGQCSLVSQQLWLLLLQLQASESSPQLAAQAATASQRLAVAGGHSSSADLAATYAPSLISALAQVHKGLQPSPH